MKTVLSKKNPFGYNRYGFLWEKLKEFNSEKHLDYGAYNGEILKTLIETDVIKEGIGVDINREVVEKSKDHMPDGALLKHIERAKKLPFPDGESILIELNRVLDQDGRLIITVPKKHLFSFLDLGNLKFVFPNMHKWYYQFRYSKHEYKQRYEDNENGLFGDIEIEKMWHQHFSKKELAFLLEKCGFVNVKFDGSGLFLRLLVLFRCVPLLGRIITRLIDWDASLFESSNLFATASKK
jgi:ubiquinone/menaquinone biosynthesis C-methylase UbiE